MKIIDIPQNTDEWLELRKGKITGSKLKDLVVKRGTGKKIGFYQLIADRLAIDEGIVDPRQRGHDLEEEAIVAFEELSGKTVKKDVGMWVSDLNENIAVSPDGAIEEDGKFIEATEVKCLGSARHIQAVIENQIPDEYFLQVLQYFIVNENLQKLYFIFYDPRVTSRPLFVLERTRLDLDDDIKQYTDYQINMLKEVDQLVSRLAF